MKIFIRIRGHFVFNGLVKSETDEKKCFNLKNSVIIYILFQYMVLSINFLFTEAQSLIEYSDSFQVSSTSTVDFSIFVFMTMKIPELYELIDDFESFILRSE